MATEWEEEFDIEVESPKFLDRTETIFETYDTEAVETQAEALDQTIGLLQLGSRDHIFPREFLYIWL